MILLQNPRPNPHSNKNFPQTKIFPLFFSFFFFERRSTLKKRKDKREERSVCVCVCVLREIESRPGLNWGMESRAVQQRQGQGGALRRCTLSRSIALATILSLSLNEQCRHDWRIQTSRRRSGRLVSRNNNYTMDLRSWDIRCQIQDQDREFLRYLSISYWYYFFFFFQGKSVPFFNKKSFNIFEEFAMIRERGC